MTEYSPDVPPDESDPVIEYIVRTRSTWGTRVYEDGTASELTDEQAGWQPLVRLSSDDATSLIEFAYEQGFFELPPDLAPETASDGGTTVQWTLVRNGERHVVTAADGQNQPLLRALNDQLQLAVGRALNREADSAGAEG